MADVDDRVKVASFMRRVWPQFDIVNNGWIVWWPDTAPPLTETHPAMTDAAVRQARRRGGIVRHPDVMALDPMARGGGAIRLVVEIDGDVHEDRLAATERRNIDYATFGVPVVVVTPQMLRTHDGVGWRAVIREGMR